MIPRRGQLGFPASQRRLKTGRPPKMILRNGCPNLFLGSMCQHTGLGACSSMFCLESVGWACSLHRVSYAPGERWWLCDRRRWLTSSLSVIFLSLCMVLNWLADSFQRVSSCNMYITEHMIIFRIFMGLKIHAWGGALYFGTF